MSFSLLHNNFLASTLEYEACENYWRNFFKEINYMPSCENDWITFRNPIAVLADGTTIHPVKQQEALGSVIPIIHVISNKLRRGVIIDQMTCDEKYLNDDRLLLFDAKIQTDFYSYGYAQGEIAMLILKFVLSTEIQASIKDILRKWNDKNICQSAMKEIIEKRIFEFSHLKSA